MRLNVIESGNPALKAFPEQTHAHLSIDIASSWVSSLGYQLFLLDNGSIETSATLDLESATMGQLQAYRNFVRILGSESTLLRTALFSFERCLTWINPRPFALFLNQQDDFQRLRSFAASESRPNSRASSFYDLATASSSHASLAPSSRPASSMSIRSDLSNPDTDVDARSESGVSARSFQTGSDLDSTISPVQNDSVRDLDAPQLKRKTIRPRRDDPSIRITTYKSVDRLIPISVVPRTWDIPNPADSAAYLFHASTEADQSLLKNDDGILKDLGQYIRQEVQSTGLKIPFNFSLYLSKDQDSWDTKSSGHKTDTGDTGVAQLLSESPYIAVRCRRLTMHCNGLDSCALFDTGLVDHCVRYAADPDEMHALWVPQLQDNQEEAASHLASLARYHRQIHEIRCKVQCNGVPKLVRISGNRIFNGHSHFVGCSGFQAGEDHRYSTIPSHIDEEMLRHTLDNAGQLPDLVTVKDKCSFTSNPRFGAKQCNYSHIIDGVITRPGMVERKCPVKMIILIPTESEQRATPELAYKAIIYFSGPHNHPAWPISKMGSQEKRLLASAIKAVGVRGLTPSQLLNSPSTSDIFGSAALGTVSTALLNNRYIRGEISSEKKNTFPRGTGWEGLVHYHSITKRDILPSDRYIHAVINKGGFRVVVTMHPELAERIHQVRYLAIDFTFSRVHRSERMDEWEIAGFLDSVQKRFTFGSLFCDTKSTEAYLQLWIELFDAIKRITGRVFKLAPFYPDANCRVILLDGEVAQALGLGEFLKSYNDPATSGIHARDPIELLSYVLKTCSVHFHRHVKELEKTTPFDLVQRIRSFPGLETRDEVESWLAEMPNALQPYPDAHNWLKHKLSNRWILPSLSPVLSNIASDDFKTTPNHTNIVETAHAARNAETQKHVGLLDAILEFNFAEQRDNTHVANLIQMERSGILHRRNNTIYDREVNLARRAVWQRTLAAKQDIDIGEYQSVKAKIEDGKSEYDASLKRSKALEQQIKYCRNALRINHRDEHFRLELKERLAEEEAEKSARRTWRSVRRPALDARLLELRSGPLARKQIPASVATQAIDNGAPSSSRADAGQPVELPAELATPESNLEPLDQSSEPLSSTLLLEPEFGNQGAIENSHDFWSFYWPKEGPSTTTIVDTTDSFGHYGDPDFADPVFFNIEQADMAALNFDLSESQMGSEFAGFEEFSQEVWDQLISNMPESVGGNSTDTGLSMDQPLPSAERYVLPNPQSEMASEVESTPAAQLPLTTRREVAKSDVQDAPRRSSARKRVPRTRSQDNKIGESTSKKPRKG
ncbi:unnamed protein product [Mycena citricolor]|uniref:Uncharacterized protein n=1 Tax=Mycena citricolor TaxID=2018698 RepID=A0AAD2HVL9_9AGAR|nr:unnamed protein product [Mycena citricolor]